MTHFNKKRIRQSSNGRTSTNAPDLMITTIDSVYNKYKSPRSFFYMDSGRSEDDMTVIKLGADCPIPMVLKTSGKLEDWYQLINCSRIDIITVRIGGRHYDIILDDESLFQRELFTSATDKEGNPLLMGNLIVCNFNDEGEETSLTDEDVGNILSHIRDAVGCETDNPRHWTLLYGIEM